MIVVEDIFLFIKILFSHIADICIVSVSVVAVVRKIFLVAITVCFVFFQWRIQGLS